MDKFWKHRYESIRNFEKHLWRNGTKVLKFFLHLSRDERRVRFLRRIDEPDKNWKFSESDVAERRFWEDYQQAYEDAINATLTEHSPWFVVPADDKKTMRLIVAQIVLEQLKALDMKYPDVSVAKNSNNAANGCQRIEWIHREKNNLHSRRLSRRESFSPVIDQ